jgi:hypothetical protein
MRTPQARPVAQQATRRLGLVAPPSAAAVAGLVGLWPPRGQGLVGGERLAADGALVPLRRRGNAWGTCVVALPARQHEQAQREVLVLRGGRAAEVMSPLPGALLPRPPFAGHLLRAGDDTLLMVVVSLPGFFYRW